ncbi:MAG: sulfatase-like hydrolase/transferase [Paracoccaceae bacterium]
MAGAPRNLVLVSFDDMVAFWLFWTFGPELRTPNLDRICARSTAFHAAYAQGHTVCSPSRASFMSGLAAPDRDNNSRRDYFDRIPPARLWPHRLRQAGYHCSSGGKVMRGYAPLPAEVHDALYSSPPKLFPLGPRPRVLRAQGLPGRVELGGFRGGPVTTDPAEDAKLYDAQVAASAEAFFAGYDGAAPFYREIGFAGTHGPWTTPLRFKEMYDPKTVKRPRAWHAGFDPCPAMDAETPPNINTSHYRFWSEGTAPSRRRELCRRPTRSGLGRAQGLETRG